jgi:hypothetical protein
MHDRIGLALSRAAAQLEGDRIRAQFETAADSRAKLAAKEAEVAQLQLRADEAGRRVAALSAQLAQLRRPAMPPGLQAGLRGHYLRHGWHS